MVFVSIDNPVVFQIPGSALPAEPARRADVPHGSVVSKPVMFVSSLVSFLIWIFAKKMNPLYFLLGTGSSVLGELLAGSKGGRREVAPRTAVFASTERPASGNCSKTRSQSSRPFQILNVVQTDAVPAPSPSRRFLASGGEVGQVGQR